MVWGGVGMMTFVAHERIFDATEMMTFLAHEHIFDATEKWGGVGWGGVGVGWGGDKVLHIERKITSLVHSHPPSHYICKHMFLPTT